MFQFPRPKLGSAVRQMDIIDIRDDLVHLTNNRYRMIVKINSINFELKSEEEQDSIIFNYEAFLNSIGFPIQILVRTRAIDIDDYLEQLKSKENKEEDSIYKTQLSSYRQFVKSLVKNNKILSKYFYIIIPFETVKRPDPSLIKEQINVRADIIQKNLSRLSIGCRVLNSLEIIDLFYSFYNPIKAKIQPISSQYLGYLASNYIGGSQ
jgi:hypothetical protein